MGEKGSKKTKESDISLAIILHNSGKFKKVSYKSMFGGYGIFNDNVMFAMVHNSDVFLKVDDTNIDTLRALGGKKHGKMPYFSIPKAVLENKSEFNKLAKMSIAISAK